MRPVSATARAKLTRAHRRAARISVLDSALNPIEGAVLTGAAGYAISGSVRIDRTRDVRRTCDLTIANPDGVWTPRGLGDLFYWDRLLKLERGVYLDPSTIEWFSLGVFVIDQPVVDVAASTLRITGVDRMDRVLRSKFTTPTTYAIATRLQTVLAAIAVDAGIGSTFHRLDDGGKTLAAARTFDADTPRIDALRQLARDYTLEAYADADGVFVVEPWRDPIELASAWTFSPGEAAVMTGLSKTWSKDRLYNHVRVTGEASDVTPIVSAEAIDDDPASVTYYLGPLGDRLFTYASAMIRSTTQAQLVANAMLVEHALVEETIDLPHSPIPMLEAGDVVAIAETTSDTEGRYQIQSMTMPLGAGGATLETRRLRSLLA